MNLSPDILLTLNLNQQLFIDPRRIALLKAIDQTGSLSQAAKQIGLSYKTAWDAISEINKLTAKPFLITATGGKNGGGTKLSAYAVRFIQLYDLLTQLQHNAFNILNDDNVPLDDILKATAKLSLQTSARNQLYGYVKHIEANHIAGYVDVKLSDNQTELKGYITQQSIERLKLSMNKTVLLLIKAPLIELNDANENCLSVEVETIKTDGEWTEIKFLLPSGIQLYASKVTHEVKQYALYKGKRLTISIHPQHIIVATLV
ncbi:LysR family transcriptional regulator [Gilliamella sp. B2776]|uniref:TOBE domain-containing protein n=1 Tax=unclassified Gilliamella TaxID=2685620 RepID=UPI00226AB22F|nr:MULTISPECIES: TOBE domain-containing protein [unclassified Gilliamella]MCX8649114.1 LysR family transcriptional regulator [Gilliamella sp. B2779]MCX8653010.1 LysR family transcriptional regulator [Gilliamella sp. B2737]MCX8664753.1 LysR family transcriptional regulator [Gilliamella sp. B2887]MCX8690926.1 LysR family transcriptional regulator [Gilliamella sp. B2776]MCX8697348.1 LysR family transcriptional regulator [Gilliamella sp. B3000]